MGKVIANHRRLKLKGSKEANLTSQKAIWKAREADKIRELYRAIFEFPEKPSEIGLRKKKEIETGWEFLGASRKVNSADRIVRLSDLWF